MAYYFYDAKHVWTVGIINNTEYMVVTLDFKQEHSYNTFFLIEERVFFSYGNYELIINICISAKYFSFSPNSKLICCCGMFSFNIMALGCHARNYSVAVYAHTSTLRYIIDITIQISQNKIQ